MTSIIQPCNPQVGNDTKYRQEREHRHGHMIGLKQDRSLNSTFLPKDRLRTETTTDSSPLIHPALRPLYADNAIPDLSPVPMIPSHSPDSNSAGITISDRTPSFRIYLNLPPTSSNPKEMMVKCSPEQMVALLVDSEKRCGYWKKRAERFEREIGECKEKERDKVKDKEEEVIRMDIAKKTKSEETKAVTPKKRQRQDLKQNKKDGGGIEELEAAWTNCDPSPNSCPIPDSRPRPQCQWKSNWHPLPYSSPIFNTYSEPPIHSSKQNHRHPAEAHRRPHLDHMPVPYNPLLAPHARLYQAECCIARMSMEIADLQIQLELLTNDLRKRQVGLRECRSQPSLNMISHDLGVINTDRREFSSPKSLSEGDDEIRVPTAKGLESAFVDQLFPGLRVEDEIEWPLSEHGSDEEIGVGHNQASSPSDACISDIDNTLDHRSPLATEPVYRYESVDSSTPELEPDSGLLPDPISMSQYGSVTESNRLSPSSSAGTDLPELSSALIGSENGTHEQVEDIEEVDHEICVSAEVPLRPIVTDRKTLTGLEGFEDWARKALSLLELGVRDEGDEKELRKLRWTWGLVWEFEKCLASPDDGEGLC